MKMKTYMQKIQDTHSCPESEGKIVCIQTDKLGNKYCAYCGKKVDYPNPTEQEVKEIMEKIKNGEAKIEERN